MRLDAINGGPELPRELRIALLHLFAHAMHRQRQLMARLEGIEVFV